ncbi:DUF4280 domain-containing protein [Clostridium saccharobutylicum]|uniref:DUF4280 domain-containing protein n=1 Tax=Clostridium saccharobutylicum DSM 13864 TaxID=1345695 RepID=U5MQ85_CLOSA|nr:DUF4280 domain-containing protein [Clostridium saccharobutylicum]AGX41846.1 hypothetical protein CLSA_c08330 [Clostridium saccharobutylicum DSM 13864]AQR89121.1 hypothetical protein CLOSC_08170 [Clostridium saccharobutylicum]AQR99022.1 hypothetical protein CSACC_08240 [Clostridium saccharobutylicum]AQS13010.1 hypothetical protein CLOSACC_08240 [Clostridium saccharobutylicum]MBA2903870.1 hypothetical protein [Clostridium saccharobutylicum]
MSSDVSYVARGAKMQCSKGSNKELKINLPASHGAYAQGKALMVETDNVVEANITSFGLCEGEKCCPIILGKWTKCEYDTLINGVPALTTDSELICAKGGRITFVTDGQNE